MKKLLLAVAAVALIASSADAQSKKKSKSSRSTAAVESEDGYEGSTRTRTRSASIPVSRVIPQVSVIMSSIVGDAWQNVNGRTGFGFGGLLDIGRSDWVFETGVLYRTMGVSNQDASLNLNYLAVPINAKYYFMGQKAAFGVFAKGGLIPAFNVGASVTQAGQSQNVRTASGFDLALDIGAGTKVAMTETLDIYGELNYARSLTDALSNVAGANSALTIQAGLAVEL